MPKTIINAKADANLKEALRIVAFKKKLNKSQLIVETLSADPDISRELKKLSKKPA